MKDQLIIYNQTTLQTYLPEFRKGQLFRQYNRAYFYMREMVINQYYNGMARRYSPDDGQYFITVDQENQIVEQQSQTGWTICTLDHYNQLISQCQVDDCKPQVESMWMVGNRRGEKIAQISHQWALQIYRQLVGNSDVNLDKLTMFIVVNDMETQYNDVTLWLHHSNCITRVR